jgi:hypothetical protein
MHPWKRQVKIIKPWAKYHHSCFLLPHKSHECGFIFILCHKNYRKTTFNFGIPHAKFAMTSRWRYADLYNNTHDVIEIPRWHWCNRGNLYTTCCIRYFYTTPDTTARSLDSTDQILLVFYEIYRVCVCWSDFDGIFFFRFRKFGICMLEITTGLD